MAISLETLLLAKKLAGGSGGGGGGSAPYLFTGDDVSAGTVTYGTIEAALLAGKQVFLYEDLGSGQNSYTALTNMMFQNGTAEVYFDRAYLYASGKDEPLSFSD